MWCDGLGGDFEDCFFLLFISFLSPLYLVWGVFVGLGVFWLVGGGSPCCILPS
ncbi:hypothetical protein BDV33DRAFT_183054 [Aspergillus novoparasiticus]|uniref:Transmembrane protein n=1 Tax=Aspergillus novoparasiticus TaxID=986946 RepID=A0A5N6E9H9_9EURO|nr:hypothetical protein BDV33DRAFT_183054 [Aspergillus novoparasiticus]